VKVDGTSAIYDGATQVGLYRVSSGKFQDAFGVSLLDANESDLTPKNSLSVGGEPLVGSSQARSNRDCGRGLFSLRFLFCVSNGGFSIAACELERNRVRSKSTVLCIIYGSRV
jgi:hypothetical protein